MTQKFHVIYVYGVNKSMFIQSYGVSNEITDSTKVSLSNTFASTSIDLRIDLTLENASSMGL